MVEIPWMMTGNAAISANNIAKNASQLSRHHLFRAERFRCFSLVKVTSIYFLTFGFSANADRSVPDILLNSSTALSDGRWT